MKLARALLLGWFGWMTSGALACVADRGGETTPEDEELGAASSAVTATIDLPCVIDTRMEQSAPDHNYALVNTWGDGSTGAQTRSLFRFDVSRIPTGATLASARLKLTIGDGSPHAFEFNEVLRPWTETGATWNSYASAAAWGVGGAEASSDRGTSVLASFANAAAGALNLPLTSAGLDTVRRWYTTPGANYGFLFRASTSASTDGVRIENRHSATPPVLEVTYTTSTRSPYGGSARAVPGRIEAEHFDEGGAGVAYNDTTAGNSGAWTTRNPTDVDLEATSDTGGGTNVGWVGAGEWLEYSITSSVAATYLIEARVAATTTGRTIRFRAGSSAATADVAVPNTGGYQAWQTTVATPIAVPAGTSVLRVYTATGGFNLNWINVRTQTPQTTGGMTMKVISWNLAHGSHGSTPMGDYLAQQNAHVILTQETSSSLAAAIRNRLGTGWDYRFYTGESEGVAVFTRLPIISHETRNIGPSSWGGYREALRVVVDANGTPVSAISTHLDWPRYGVWGEDSAHALGRNNFMAWVSSISGNRVFGGDFNGDVSGNATQRQTITSADATGLDSCVALGRTQSGCRSAYPTKDSGSRFDYVYISRNSDLSVLSHAVVPHNGLSDHDMVVTEINVR